MKVNKCILVFLGGVTISLASYAFFNQMMQMGNQMMQVPMNMMQPQQPCDCSCKTK